jgi:hypothetical protein
VTGAPLRLSVRGPKMIFSIALPGPALDLLVDMTKAVAGLPPDFLSSLFALANLMRLSLLKAAHANLFCAVCRKSGSPALFGPRMLVRTWGTRPVFTRFC